MSGHFLLAPIPESSSDYLLPKDIKLAVLGAGRVGKSGEWGKGAPPGDSRGPHPQGYGKTPACFLWQSTPELWKGLAAVEGRSSLNSHIPRGSHFIPGTWGKRALFP